MFLKVIEYASLSSGFFSTYEGVPKASINLIAKFLGPSYSQSPISIPLYSIYFFLNPIGLEYLIGYPSERSLLINFSSVE